MAKIHNFFSLVFYFSKHIITLLLTDRNFLFIVLISSILHYVSPVLLLWLQIVYFPLIKVHLTVCKQNFKMLSFFWFFLRREIQRPTCNFFLSRYKHAKRLGNWIAKLFVLFFFCLFFSISIMFKSPEKEWEKRRRNKFTTKTKT